MVWVFATLLSLLNLGFLFTVMIGMPGTWLMLIATVIVAWVRRGPAQPEGEPMFSLGVLITLLVLAIVGEIIEFVAGVAGAKGGGGTKWGAGGALLGTLVGGIVGTIAFPFVLGSLVGACLGAAIGAVTFELYGGRRLQLALRSGYGAAIGRLGGTLGKLAVGVVMWVIITVAAFWP